MPLVNDVHSRMNLTKVSRMVTPESAEEIQEAVRGGGRVSIAGVRHTMRAQQFGTGTTLLDMTRWLAEAGPWGIRQKQTGADRLTVGGAVAVNAHGRGLLRCSRRENAEDFLRRDVISCNRPVAPDTPVPDGRQQLREQDWRELLYLAHTVALAGLLDEARWNRRYDPVERYQSEWRRHHKGMFS